MVDQEAMAAGGGGALTVPERKADGTVTPVALKRDVVVTGNQLNNASATIDSQTQRPAVSVRLDEAGGRAMRAITRDNIGKLMAIVLYEKGKGEAISVARIQGEFGNQFQITGNFSVQETTDLALLIRSGSLAAPMEIIEERTIGPSLGKENIERGFRSTLYGFTAIAVFMIAYYRVFGLISVVSLSVNVMLLIALLSLLQATLTLPGIAAIALTLGMAIDANVLINERVREELRNGRNPQQAICEGYEKAFATILDSNITTLIAGVALLIFGSGPVRGFAVVHCLGILTSIFSAVFVSRAIVNLVYGSRRKLQVDFDRPDLAAHRHGSEVAEGRRQSMEFFRIKRTIPFMRYSLILNAISFISFGIAVAFLLTRGLNLSVDFTGGTVMEVRYPQAANLELIRDAIEKNGWGESQVQNFGTSRDVLIRLPLEKGTSAGQQADRVMQTLKAQEPAVELKRVEFVGPAVGEELAHDGLLALLMVVIGIMIYLAFRFEWKFSVAAIVANLHDVILVIGMFAIFRWEFSLPVLAAVLAVLGYSVNESVIIFDRVREHFKKFRKMSTVEVIDSAITATISRTIITHGSTLCMTLAMYFFGGPALHYFALALTIGIIFGIYSSVFVAAAIAMYLGVKREDLVKPVKKDEEQQVLP